MLRTCVDVCSLARLTRPPQHWPNFTSDNLTGKSCPNALLDANSWSCGYSLHSQRPAVASFRGWEERGGGEARSAVPRRRRSGLPTLRHRRHPQTTGPGPPEQESSAPGHLTSCPWGHPAHGAQHRASGELMTQVCLYSVCNPQQTSSLILFRFILCFPHLVSSLTTQSRIKKMKMIMMLWVCIFFYIFDCQLLQH